MESKVEPPTQLMTATEVTKYKTFFDSRKQNRELISFNDFITIARDNPEYDQNKVTAFIEGIKKELKSKNPDAENFMLNETEYNKYLLNLVIEHHKNVNSQNEELQSLFDVLSKGEDTVRKNVIVDILDTYAVGIDYNVFFVPIGKKDILTFGDFCCLFKAPENRGVLNKTFTSGFGFEEEKRKDQDDENKPEKQFGFPIKPVK
jgi:hypothetical protein